MTDTRDFYQILGIGRDATPGDIRAAYVRLARHHHPDSGIPLPWRLQDVQRAYQCLSDDDARAHHDHALAERDRQHRARQRRVQRRLHRYDARHPRPQPVAPEIRRRRRWRIAIGAIGAIGAAVVAWLVWS